MNFSPSHAQRDYLQKRKERQPSSPLRHVTTEEKHRNISPCTAQHKTIHIRVKSTCNLAKSAPLISSPSDGEASTDSANGNPNVYSLFRWVYVPHSQGLPIRVSRGRESRSWMFQTMSSILLSRSATGFFPSPLWPDASQAQFCFPFL